MPTSRPRQLSPAAAPRDPRTSRVAGILWVHAVAALLLVAGGCAPAEEAEDQAEAGPRVENRALGIALAQLPASFEVVRNEGDELVLGRSDGDDPARLSVELGPVQAAGVNLVDRVWEEKERIESLPEGVYQGQNELGGVPLGTTFTSRGRFLDDEGERVEEYRALALHPVENRVLVLDYEYPAPPPGEEPEHDRLQELMLVLEQLEAADAGTGPADGGEGEGTAEPPAPSG